MQKSLFSVPSKFCKDLNESRVSPNLKKAFGDHGIILSDQAAAKIEKEGAEWLIIDPQTREQYHIKQERIWGKFLQLIKFPPLTRIWKKLYVYQLCDEDRGAISRELAQAFGNKEVKLSQHWTIRTEEKGTEWQIIDWGQQQSPAEQRLIQAYHITHNGKQFHVRDVREGRAYKTTPLPTLKGPSKTVGQETLLVQLYGEICNSWRQLTEVRFKLLGFVPTVSVVILINLLAGDDDRKGLTPTAQAMIAVFGLLITVALYVYEKRNSELYDDLISRGRKIEEELGIDTGQFLGRREASKRLLKLLTIQHDWAIAGIYWTSIGGWLAALVYIWARKSAGLVV